MECVQNDRLRSAAAEAERGEIRIRLRTAFFDPRAITPTSVEEEIDSDAERMDPPKPPLDTRVTHNGGGDRASLLLGRDPSVPRSRQECMCYVRQISEVSRLLEQVIIEGSLSEDRSEVVCNTIGM